MPIYEYQCQECKHIFETMQKINEPPFLDCPACSAPKLQKIISSFGFRLKGKGWYETDFKGNTNKK